MSTTIVPYSYIIEFINNGDWFALLRQSSYQILKLDFLNTSNVIDAANDDMTFVGGNGTTTTNASFETIVTRNKTGNPKNIVPDFDNFSYAQSSDGTKKYFTKALADTVDIGGANARSQDQTELLVFRLIDANEDTLIRMRVSHNALGDTFFHSGGLQPIAEQLIL
jgi:hypothetical protein